MFVISKETGKNQHKKPWLVFGLVNLKFKKTKKIRSISKGS